jgi:hypothetical protein
VSSSNAISRMEVGLIFEPGISVQLTNTCNQ